MGTGRQPHPAAPLATPALSVTVFGSARIEPERWVYEDMTIPSGVTRADEAIAILKERHAPWHEAHGEPGAQPTPGSRGSESAR